VESGVQEFRSSGVQEFRSSGVQELGAGNQGVRGQRKGKEEDRLIDDPTFADVPRADLSIRRGTSR
jgi:hypothetical protein